MDEEKKRGRKEEKHKEKDKKKRNVYKYIINHSIHLLEFISCTLLFPCTILLNLTKIIFKIHMLFYIKTKFLKIWEKTSRVDGILLIYIAHELRGLVTLCYIGKWKEKIKLTDI